MAEQPVCMRLTPSACLPLTTSASATATDVVGAATSFPPAERASRIISAGLLVPNPFWSGLRSSLNHLYINVGLLLTLLVNMSYIY